MTVTRFVSHGGSTREPLRVFCLVNRFTGNAICALAASQHGASQLLARGVMSILADLPNVKRPYLATRGGDPAEYPPEGILIGEECVLYIF